MELRLCRHGELTVQSHTQVLCSIHNCNWWMFWNIVFTTYCLPAVLHLDAVLNLSWLTVNQCETCTTHSDGLAVIVEASSPETLTYNWQSSVTIDDVEWGGVGSMWDCKYMRPHCRHFNYHVNLVMWLLAVLVEKQKLWNNWFSFFTVFRGVLVSCVWYCLTSCLCHVSVTVSYSQSFVSEVDPCHHDTSMLATRDDNDERGHWISLLLRIVI